MLSNPQEPGISAESYDTAPASQGINVRHYWYVLLERRWLVVCTWLLVMALAGVYLYKAPRVYRATTTIQIDPESETSLNLRDAVVRLGADQDYLQTQYKRLLSRSLLEAVARKERLHDDPRYAGELDVIKAVASDISIIPLRLTRLVTIAVEHTRAEKAAEIANALANEFIDSNATLRQRRTTDMLLFLKNNAAALEGDVSKAEQDLHDYRMSKKFVSLEKGDINVIAESLSRSQQEYTAAKAVAQTTQTTVNEMQKHVDSGKPLATFPAIANDPQMKALESQLALAENELAAQLKKYKDKHPKIIDLRSRVEQTRQTIAATAERLADIIRTQARVALAQEQSADSLVKMWENKQTEWNAAKMQYDVYARKAETSKALYNAVLTKMKEIEILQKEKANNIHVVDPAPIPVSPVKPNIPITIVLGIVGGLALSFALALFVNYLDDTIKSQDDIETYLRLPFLGYIPNVKSNSLIDRYQHTHRHPQSNTSESFRTLRAGITLGGRGDKLRLLTVTSTVPGEGKSTVTANLAIVFAQTGLRTLLVDADLRRPSLHQGFQLRNAVGLTAYLAGKVEDVGELVQPTEIPHLDVICCGTAPSQPSELLSSRRMAQFMQSVRGRYDRVILDCPPVSAVSDPLIVSALADGVVLVTKFNKVRREMARKSVQRMLEAGLYICGVVINDIDFEGRDAYYYSYYYYQNRYYKGYYHPKPEEPEESLTGSEAEANKVEERR